MLKKKVSNYSKLFTLNNTNTFLSTFHLNYTKAKTKGDSLYKLSTETNEKPFKLSSESTGADSPLLIEKEKIRFIKKNTLLNANALSTVRLHTRNSIISPPERTTTNNDNSHFFDNRNLTTTASFPKVQTVNSFPINDFSILSFGQFY